METPRDATDAPGRGCGGLLCIFAILTAAGIANTGLPAAVCIATTPMSLAGERARDLADRYVDQLGLIDAGLRGERARDPGRLRGLQAMPANRHARSKVPTGLVPGQEHLLPGQPDSAEAEGEGHDVTAVVVLV